MPKVRLRTADGVLDLNYDLHGKPWTPTGKADPELARAPVTVGVPQQGACSPCCGGSRRKKGKEDEGVDAAHRPHHGGSPPLGLSAALKPLAPSGQASANGDSSGDLSAASREPLGAGQPSEGTGVGGDRSGFALHWKTQGPGAGGGGASAEGGREGIAAVREGSAGGAMAGDTAARADAEAGHYRGVNEGGGGGGDGQRPTLAHAGGEHCSPEGHEPCDKIMFVCGLSARGRTEFFQQVVADLAGLQGPQGEPLVTVCTFDNRGIGCSTIPQAARCYTTANMAADTRALMDHLGWPRAHFVGLSMGGMVLCKLAASHPERCASMTLIATTSQGWHMLVTLMKQPRLAMQAGSKDLEKRIPVNLRFNLSEAYLQQVLPDGRTRAQALTEDTREAIRHGWTEKFLAEGQPSEGKMGQSYAVGMHRLSGAEVQRIREARVPVQMINGKHDLVASYKHVLQLARRLQCPLILTEGAHAGICVETPQPVLSAVHHMLQIEPAGQGWRFKEVVNGGAAAAGKRVVVQRPEEPAGKLSRFALAAGKALRFIRRR